jgi:CubicO group peptidase (beta-lactamase class C family)
LEQRVVEALRAVAEEAMAELRVPGVSVWVLAGGAEDGFQLGITSVDNPLAVDQDTVFQAGSITKTLTATAALRLAQRGVLDLDAPVRRYLPGLRLADEDVAAAITMRDLLSHGGGFVGDWFDDFGWGDDALARYVEHVEALPQLTPLRAVWSYNNAGFGVAGRVLEAVAGAPYEDVVGEFAPPGALFAPTEVMLRRFVVGHVTENDEVHVVTPWAVPRATAPQGGLVCSAKALVAYARMHMEDETLAVMREPLLATQRDEWMGLAWFVKDLSGVRFAQHGGTTNGQNAWLALAPDRGFAIAVLTNHQFGHALIGRVLEQAFQDLLGVAPWQPELLDVPVERLREYVGRYQAPLNTLEFRVEDVGLVLEVIPEGGFPKPESPPRPAPPPAPVAFHAEDEFYVTDGVLKNNRGEFLRDDDGTIAWVRFGRRIRGQPRRSSAMGLCLRRKSRIRLRGIRAAQIPKSGRCRGLAAPRNPTA